LPSYQRYAASLKGHGSVDGSNGNIVYELDSITTALAIIKEAYINIK